ncbi:HyaD/HybD family hydrogenase maturation endopeptidase [Oryzomonas sagensis]|uniref:HyaD/HybD family hydrogenase maturation endopeptidase n=1 Tax=Oryzomonas sagensis TaxID=2603857 RepID=A0ABQ6TMW4_9BACT|nr:HyaD/HybD family hydrogenase maturation endopeptidase [Oryzomonas sagensis]KAB0669765.1 HyaD/HybD family hydrogenase maturation endopeptidase [Oryzomonas sagensis]
MILHDGQAQAPAILVLGIGNLVMCDDGVGVRVVQELQKRYRFPPQVEIMDGGTLGLDLLPMLEGIGRLLVVDAVETGGKPGTLVRLSGKELPIALQTKVSPHQMGLKDLLAVAELLGHAPREMVLVGIQPASIEMGAELSQNITAQLEKMIGNVLTELNEWGVEARPF